MIEVLNLYAGIGGNRKKWKNCKVTAVELNPEIAHIYKELNPDDEVVIADAHEYLLNNFERFDFIWSSTPCQTHSRMRNILGVSIGQVKAVYPDMSLYQEIIFLKRYCKGKFIVENVIPHYAVLITPTFQIGKHLFWSNFQVRIPSFDGRGVTVEFSNVGDYQKHLDIDISRFKLKTRRQQVLRNCVHPDIGEFLFNEAIREKGQKELF